MATRWYNHFLSRYRDDVINNNPLLTPILELDSPPFEEELSQALSKLKKRKAGGKFGILPELILCGGPELWSMQNIEVDATGMERRENSGRVAGCSSCPSSKERGSQTL